MATIFEAATHKSPGHIGVEYVNGYPAFEWYERNDQVVRAPIYNAIDVDGYRLGRWECSSEYFHAKRDFMLQRWDIRS